MPRCEGLDFAAGCDLGQDYGLLALRFMADHQLSPLLGWVALDMAGERAAGGERGGAGGWVAAVATLGGRGGAPGRGRLAWARGRLRRGLRHPGDVAGGRRHGPRRAGVRRTAPASGG